MIIIIFITGLIIGSFMNNVISYLCGYSKFDVTRSVCFCGERELKITELIPVINYFTQNGKCTACGKKISLRYPLVEIISAILVSLCYKLFPDPFYFFLYSILVLSLVIIGVVDYYKFIIPNKLILVIALLSILKIIHEGNIVYLNLLTPIFILLFFASINILYNKLKGQNAIGFGDIKLLFVLGLFFNMQLSLIGIWLSSFIAIPGYYIIKALKHNEIIDHKVQFGFFISIAFLIILFTQNFLTSQLNYLMGSQP
jgi:leader peptidase (prepilin peptidase)/N-methyltransferase